MKNRRMTAPKNATNRAPRNPCVWSRSNTSRAIEPADGAAHDADDGGHDAAGPGAIAEQERRQGAGDEADDQPTDQVHVGHPMRSSQVGRAGPRLRSRKYPPPPSRRAGRMRSTSPGEPGSRPSTNWTRPEPTAAAPRRPLPAVAARLGVAQVARWRGTRRRCQWRSGRAVTPAGCHPSTTRCAKTGQDGAEVERPRSCAPHEVLSEEHDARGQG